jgi:uncharacterized protein YndB with AHSA1/START domain
MTESGSIAAHGSRSTFRMETSVATDIDAPVERVWSLLTDAPGMTGWNSTLTSIEGPIELSGTVKMRVPEAPGRTFAPKVTRFEANRMMEWREGNPLFLGVRTYTLTPGRDGHSTRFEMTEVFSGLMLPMIAGRLPDFGPIFERYATDLKARAELEPDVPSLDGG